MNHTKPRAVELQMFANTTSHATPTAVMINSSTSNKRYISFTNVMIYRVYYSTFIITAATKSWIKPWYSTNITDEEETRQRQDSQPSGMFAVDQTRPSCVGNRVRMSSHLINGGELVADNWPRGDH
jgi:hypothetical protein